MASAISHAVVGLSLGTCFVKPRHAISVLLMGAACSVFPDIDVLGFRFGIRYDEFWGHRGFTHSLVFAFLLAFGVMLLFFRREGEHIGRFPLFAYLFLATASHGLLDAMTNGGLGVAFFSPFNNRRYFLPGRPIRVSPISVGRFFSSRGYIVLENEIFWIWLPAGILAGLALMLRHKAQMNTSA
jgi:inner membrane protein